jgi:hypothetical protein
VIVCASKTRHDADFWLLRYIEMWRRLFVLLFPVAVLSAPAILRGQAPPDQAAVPSFQAYGGYSYFFRSYDSTNQTPIHGGMNGWDASLRAPLPLFGSRFSPWLGLTADAAGAYRSDPPFELRPHTYFFLAGPQASIATGRSMLFAHAMAGVGLMNRSGLASLSSNATFAFDLGAGYDYAIREGWAWRVSLDYVNSHFNSSDGALQDLANSNGRITTGPVFRFDRFFRF